MKEQVDIDGDGYCDCGCGGEEIYVEDCDKNNFLNSILNLITMILILVKHFLDMV